MCGRLRRRRPHTSRGPRDPLRLCAFAPPQACRRWTRPHRAQKLRPTPIELAARVGRPTPDARQPTISLKPAPPPPQSIFCGGRCDRRSDAIIDINYCHRSRCVRTGPSDSEHSIGGNHLSSGRVRARARPTERAADAPLERAKRARPLTALKIGLRNARWPLSLLAQSSFQSQRRSRLNHRSPSGQLARARPPHRCAYRPY